MNTGRHFSPPTPAIRPEDPFSNMKPRSAEVVPSCEAVTPPPFRPRAVRVDPAEPKDAVATKDGHARRYMEPKAFSDTTVAISKQKFPPRRGRRPTPPQYIEPLPKKPEVVTSKEAMISKLEAVRKESRMKDSVVKEKLKRAPAGNEELKKCEWAKCENTFVVKVRGHAAVRKYCSATCRGRASEARTGKRTGAKK